jgi:hypothetical protein
MPPVVADIVLVRTQVLEALVAMPRFARYTDAIGENSQYQVKQEITDKILLTDGILCGDVIATPGHPWRSSFMVPSSPLLHGDFVPRHTGAHGDVQVSVGGVYDFSAPAKSKEEIFAMRANPGIYGAASRFHFIEDNVAYHSGDFAKVWYPSFTKTAACQSPQTYEDLLFYGSVQISEKLDNSDPLFGKCNGLFMAGRSLVRTGAMLIPAQQELEAATRKPA